IEVAYSGESISLSQQKYVLDILDEVGLLGAKPVDFSMDPNVKLNCEHGVLLHNPAKYRRLVGKPNYLTVTPDISFVVSTVSQFMGAPCTTHSGATLRIVKYLKEAPGRGLLFTNHGHLDVHGYSDADWAGCPVDRRSNTGYCVFLGGNLVAWKSKKTVVSKSSAEAEYRAMAHVASEIMWLRMLLSKLCIVVSQPSQLWCNNQAAIHIVAIPMFLERTKHIEVNCHFVREKVEAKIISLSYVRTGDQLEDIFTKPL
ncbi:LOW QUALITY PROTEIN: hypothetical protein CFOL_v3_22443, partial [Cephalotus follicularis]